MNQYIVFLMAHWELSLIVALAFVWVIFAEIKSRRSEVLGVQPQAAIDLINKKSAKIFDLRKPEIFNSGHIIGAKHATFDIAKDDPKTALKISPNTYCLFVCNIGQTSMKAVEALRAKGYTNTFSLNGGMTGWRKENLPVTIGK